MRPVEAQPLHFSPSVRKSTENVIIAKTTAALFEFIPRGEFWPCSLIPSAGQFNIIEGYENKENVFIKIFSYNHRMV